MKGPDIFKIARTRTKITVFWDRILSCKIEKYKVCYGRTIKDANDCSSEKVVDGNNDNAILDELNAFTDYTMAVRAMTSEISFKNIYGNPGKALTVKTCEFSHNCLGFYLASKYCCTFYSAHGRSLSDDLVPLCYFGVL